MGGVSQTFGGRVSVTLFTESEDQGRVVRLAAAAVWRGEPEWPRLPLRRRLTQAFGELRRRFPLHFKWNVGWAGATGPHGDREVQYNRERGIMRVLGVDYAAPTDGRTLVLLIDDDEPDSRAPRVTLHSMSIAPLRAEPRDRTLDKKAYSDARIAEVRRERAAWDAALAADPVVRAFQGVGRPGH